MNLHHWKSRLRLALELLALIAFIVVGVTVTLSRAHPSSPPVVDEPAVEARYYTTQLVGRRVQCQLCFRKCTVAQGQSGECGVRVNRRGKLYSLIYGQPSFIQIDPVEKEPMYHMLPGTTTLSLGTTSCDLMCHFCLYWGWCSPTLGRIPEQVDSTPEEVVNAAIERGCSSMSFTTVAMELGCSSKAFTHNEPTVFYEYMFDVAELAQKRGLWTYFHSNGAINPEPLRELLKHMDAVCIDLKGFTSKFYKEISRSELEPVLSTLKTIRETRVHLEIVNLVIPSLNDDPKDVQRMSHWIRDNLGEDVPLHFSRFFPTVKLPKLPPTPIETLERARQIALDAGLDYVYISNVPGHIGNSTFCPNCGKVLIERDHFTVMSNQIKDGRCPFCDHHIPGLWDPAMK